MPLENDSCQLEVEIVIMIVGSNECGIGVKVLSYMDVF